MKIESQEFKDRTEALKMLFEILPTSDMIKEDWIILAISTGGVPIALELSKRLLAQFDFFFSEKIYTRKNNQCEIAIITETKEIVIHEELMRAFDLQLENIYQESNDIFLNDIQEYKRKYRRGENLIDVRDKNVLIVDEGLNTGLTIMACIKSVINKKAKSICVAVPVLPEATINDIETIADDLYYVDAPSHFVSIDFYYENLEEIKYEDIEKLINEYKKEKMSTTCELELYNQKEVFEFNKVAKQSNGSVLLTVGKTVLMATVVSEFDSPVDEDFTPLTVQYIEKTYASAKFAGGFIKREGKPSDFETLTSRIIDRSLRPLFPKGYNYPTTITVMVLSVDNDADLQTLALNAASAALYTSNIPVNESVSAARIAKVDGELIINPSLSQLDESTLDLYVAGTKSDLLMIEMRSIATTQMVEVDIESFTKIHQMNDITESELVDAIAVASKVITEYNSTYIESFEFAKQEVQDVELIVSTVDESIVDLVRTSYKKEIEDAIKVMAKKERYNGLKELAKTILETATLPVENVELEDLVQAVETVKKEIVRKLIIEDNVRADGRGPKDVRPISIETNILPSTHSSCLFTRGETQSLVVGTLGNSKDAQMYEVLTSKETQNENFMVHYNFPGFSVGEAKPIFGVSRRELGHGNLAKRALEASIDKDYGETIRLVSEIFESNGSSSMATVCGGSMALKAAGVPVSSLIAGVAMGGVFTENKHVILTDIMGLEDHDGDMDFKVAGTKEGITALQMDIKLGGISLEVLTEALAQAKEGRIHILGLMEAAAEDIVPSDALPLIEQFNIDPSKVLAVIGKAGSVIKEIIDKWQVSIDLDKSTGGVKITGDNKENIKGAVEHVKNISSNAKSYQKKETIDFQKLYKVEDVLDGKVVRLADFGAFIELPKGGEGLLHISKISKKRVNNVKDVFSEGDSVSVKVLNISKDRIELISANL